MAVGAPSAMLLAATFLVSVTLVPILLPWGIHVISLVLLPFAAIWVACAVWLGREYQRRDKALSSDATVATPASRT